MEIFSKKAKEAGEQASKTEKATGGLDSVMKALSPSSLAAVAGITALVGSLKAMTGMAKQAIEVYSHFESLQAGLETFFQDADKGKAKFEQLRKLSNETTFGVDELTDAFTQLGNVGANVDTINSKLVMLGNLAGGSKQKFADLVSIYSKILSTGSAGSMQIQQLARQGLPIQNVLKEIGVTGTATAMDITKAFRKMTDEGGQFYNAMENINKTIEGKEGYISDYFREFLVNFAEVSGIADRYKEILDFLQTKIGEVSDKLLEWNSNPVIKAIFQGALTTILTGLVVIIGVSLVGALKTVIVKLGIIAALKTALVGPAGLIGLAVAGILGLNVALKGANKEVQDLKDSANETAEAMKKLTAVELGNNFVQEYEDMNKKLEKERKRLESERDKALGKAGELVFTNKKGKTMYSDKTQYDALISVANTYDEQAKSISEQMQKNAERAKEFADRNKELSNAMTQAAERTEQFDTSLSKLRTTYANSTNAGKKADLLKQITEYQNLLKGGQGYRDGHYVKLGLSKEDEAKTKKIIENLQKEIRKLDPIENLKYQNQILDTYNQQELSLDELVNKTYELKTLEMDMTAEEKKQYIELLKQNELKDRLAKKRQGTSQRYQDALNTNAEYNQIFSSSSFNDGGLSDKVNAINAVMLGITEKEYEQLREIEKQNNIYASITGSLTNAQEALDNMDISGFLQNMQEYYGKSGQYGAYAATNLANKAINASGDAQNAIEGFEQGGIWGAVINTLLGALMNVASSMETFDKVMNPITTWMQELAPIIQVIMDFLAEFVDIFTLIFRVIGTLAPILQSILNTLKPVFNILKVIVGSLGVILKVIIPLIKMFADAIEWAINILTFGLFDSLQDCADSMTELGDVTKEESEQKQKQIEQLRALTEAMREQQEEYLKRKRQLNSETFASDVTNVHDMILTPQGRFSTDPDDYIIATKNPSGLGSGNGFVFSPNITIQNNTNAEVKTSTDDSGNMLIMISQKVAQDYVTGQNGWDSALLYKQAQKNGRNLAL